MRNTLGSFFILALAVFGVGYVLSLPYSNPLEKIDRTDPVFSRIIFGYEVRGAGDDAVVAYDYQGDPLSPLLIEQEEVEKRTESSYTKRIGTAPNGDGIYELTAYTDKTFVEDNGQWFARETGHTDQTTFAAARRASPLASLFWERAYAVDIYTGAGDGMVFTDAVGSWAAAQSGTSGTVDDTSATFLVEVIDDVGSFYIGRVFLPFDTSSIPAGGTISAASLRVFLPTGSVTNGDNDGTDYLTVVQTSQATHTGLIANDYDNIGTTEGIDTGQRKDLTFLIENVYTTITLNATGRGWIAKSGQASNCSATAGITCIGLREGHDITNNQIAAFTSNVASISSSEETGTAQDPYLSVTYTASASRVMRLLGDFRLRGVRLLGL